MIALWSCHACGALHDLYILRNGRISCINHVPSLLAEDIAATVRQEGRL